MHPYVKRTLGVLLLTLSLTGCFQMGGRVDGSNSGFNLNLGGIVDAAVEGGSNSELFRNRPKDPTLFMKSFVGSTDMVLNSARQAAAQLRMGETSPEYQAHFDYRYAIIGARHTYGVAWSFRKMRELRGGNGIIVGQLSAQFHMTDPDANDYSASGTYTFVSYDGGRTWRMSTPADIESGEIRYTYSQSRFREWNWKYFSLSDDVQQSLVQSLNNLRQGQTSGTYGTVRAVDANTGFTVLWTFTIVSQRGYAGSLFKEVRMDATLISPEGNFFSVNSEYRASSNNGGRGWYINQTR